MKHPNKSPTPDMVRELRGDMTVTAAAKLWQCDRRTVQRRESGAIGTDYATMVGLEVIRNRGW